MKYFLISMVAIGLAFLGSAWGKGESGQTNRTEIKNNAAAHPEKAEDLKMRIMAIVAKGRTTPGAGQTNDTEYWNDLRWMTKSQYSDLSR